MFIQETLKFVVDILKVPSVLVGLIALIGLLAQKIVFRRGERHGKTILGFIVLGGGAGIGRVAQSAGRHVRTRVQYSGHHSE